MSGDRYDGLDEELRRWRPGVEFPGEEIRSRIRATMLDREKEGADARTGRRRRRSRRPSDDPSRGVRRLARAALLVAASMALFVAGAEYGRSAGAPAGGERPAADAGQTLTSPDGELTVSLSVQAAGSEYVASLADLGARTDRLSADQRRVAEEVALTVLYAAIVELDRAVEDDRVLRSVADLVSARRRHLGRTGDATVPRQNGG